MKVLRYLAVALFFCVGFLSAEEEDLQILLSSDRTEMTIGSRLTISCKVFYSPAVVFEMFDESYDFSPFIFKDFVLHKIEHLKDGRLLQRVDYIVTIYQTGLYTMPLFDLKYHNKEGETLSAHSELLSIDVKSVVENPEDLTELRDIKRNVIFKISYGFWIFLGFLLLASLGAAIYAFRVIWRNRKKGRDIEPEVWISEDEEALKNLDRLRREDFSEDKDYYESLTQILRRYLERRYSFFAEESTTLEILRELKHCDLAMNHYFRLSELMNFADLVKFAKGEASEALCKESKAEAVSIVNLTKKEVIIHDDSLG